MPRPGQRLQMIGVDTEMLLAKVVDFVAVWYWTLGVFVKDPMSLLSLSTNFHIPVDDMGVARVADDRALPDPARSIMAAIFYGVAGLVRLASRMARYPFLRLASHVAFCRMGLRGDGSIRPAPAPTLAVRDVGPFRLPLASIGSWIKDILHLVMPEDPSDGFAFEVLPYGNRPRGYGGAFTTTAPTAPIRNVRSLCFPVFFVRLNRIFHPYSIPQYLDGI